MSSCLYLRFCKACSFHRRPMTDFLILLFASAVQFWTAWVLGRSLLARSAQFRICAGSDAPMWDTLAHVSLVLRVLCICVLDMFLYARFAWAPTEGVVDYGHGDKELLAEIERLRVKNAELRDDNADLRLKAFA